MFDHGDELSGAAADRVKRQLKSLGGPVHPRVDHTPKGEQIVNHVFNSGRLAE